MKTTLPVPTGRRPQPVPLRPDPAAIEDGAMRSLVRSAIAIGINATDVSTLPGEFARRTWPSDRELPLILRAAIAPTTTDSAPALTVAVQALLSALVPQSAGADLLRRGLSLEFGSAADILVPGLSLPTADFVGEGQAIPTSEAAGSDVWLSQHKLAVICSATSEMLRSPNAEELIRQVLVEAVGPALDRALLDTNPASDERPAGLRHDIAPLSLPPGANLVDALVAVVESISQVAGNGQVAVIVAPKQSVAINLLLPRQPPFAVFTSATLAPGVVVGVALNALVSAIAGPPQIDASTQAVVHEQTAPRADIGGGVMARPLRSYFQSDTVGLKLRWPISWALRDPRALAWTTTA